MVAKFEMIADLSTYLYRCLFILIFGFGSTLGYSQSMSVASFYEDETDVTAIQEETKVLDQNGDKCALIKIETTQHNFQFDTGSLGISEIENQNPQHPSEIWLYVPHGVKKLSIQHPQLGKISEYDLGLSVKKGKTYVLKLTSDQVNTLVVDYNNYQYLDVEIHPVNAKLLINGIEQKLDNNGCLNSLKLPLGIHHYRIEANNYYIEEGQIVVDNKDHRCKLIVDLKPAFGYLSMLSTPETEGASVYIDDKYIGVLPINNVEIKSGKHRLSIVKKYYKTAYDFFEMEDSGTIFKTPVLEQNYAKAKVVVANDLFAKIYIDGELVSEGAWFGKLEEGRHLVEARKLSHTIIYKEIDVSSGEDLEIKLDSPKPIYGSLQINTEPANADVFVDGVKLGRTPYYSPQVLIGERQIELELDGYIKIKKSHEIVQNRATEIKEILIKDDICQAKIYSTPNAALISIDGSFCGYTPNSLNIKQGRHKIKVSAFGYKDYERTINFNKSEKRLDINLRTNKTKSNKLKKVLTKYWNKDCYEDYIETNIYGGYEFLTKWPGIIGLNVYINQWNLDWNYMFGYEERIGFSLGFGYGFVFNRIRITPQIVLYAKRQDLHEEINPSVGITGKIDFAITSWLDLSLIPKYLYSENVENGFFLGLNLAVNIPFFDGFNY